MTNSPRHWLVITIISLIGLGLLTSCGSQPPQLRLNLIVATQGQTFLNRDGWSRTIPVAAGTTVGPNDLLEIGAGGQIVMLCSPSRVEVIQASGRNPCDPLTTGSLEKEGGRYSGGPRVPPPNVPYTITPRATLVLDEQPLLVWHHTGAVEYTVSVMRVEDGEIIWQQSGVRGDRVRYPDDSRYALRPNVAYKLIVLDPMTGRSSEDDATAGLDFTIVDADQRTFIQQQLAEIQKHPQLDATAKQLAEAVLLSSVRPAGTNTSNQLQLWGEAWLRLSEMSVRLDTPAAYQRLGDTLLAMRLPTEAAAAYETAIERAVALGDLEIEAQALRGRSAASGKVPDCTAALERFAQLNDPRANEACPATN